jgi:hypothetical protein
LKFDGRKLKFQTQLLSSEKNDPMAKEHQFVKKDSIWKYFGLSLIFEPIKGK